MANRSAWQDTQDLISGALERPPAEREQYVREHCTDPVLRERLATLLNPSTTRDDDSTSTDPRRHGAGADLSTGSRVGPYIVLRRVGRGGMGEVYLGRDPRLDRQVALKCLLAAPAAGSPTVRDHVIREARAAARITHPNVAAVYDVLEHDGRTFIVMEYVEGENLSVRMKRESLSPERIVAVGRQLASALAAAHGGGVIHRDLKPSNVQVTPDGSVKVLDFGIARDFALDPSTTRPDARMGDIRIPQPGTPAYMSPEALLGRVVDERSDLFSLAVVLFEMSTGRRPFHSGDPLDIIVSTIRKVPRADGEDRRVPRQLADVIEKGLAADPRERFQSAVEMGAALDAVRDELFPTASHRSGAGMIAVRPRIVRTAWIAAAAAAAPVLLWMLGRINSAAYNITLERTGAFAAESLQAYVVWGARSIVAPAVYAALAAIAWWTIHFIVRLAMLSGAIAIALGRIQQWWHGVAARLSLDDPRVIAQGLAALGIPALALVVWRFNELIQAWGTAISTTPLPQYLWRLGPANDSEKVLYRAVLTVLFLAFTAGFVRVLQMRAELGTRRGAGEVAAIAIVVASLLLLNEVPYRILWQNKGERIEYLGARCYVIGEAGEQWLVYCPDTPPPRNKVVGRTDPGVRRTGTVESIFTQGNPR